MKLRLLLPLCLSLGCQQSMDPAAPTSGGPENREKATGEKETLDTMNVERAYASSWAVVIGIDNYAPDNLGPLGAAVRDANAVADALEHRGFQVTRLLNEQASQRGLRGLLGDDLPRRLGPDDRVLIYFAGHGVSTGDDVKMGYLMPVDGHRDRLRATGISMQELQDWLRGYKAKHVLFVADACYSGLALRDRKTRAPLLSAQRTAYLEDVIDKKVRFSLVAGTSDQEVNEEGGHGVFTRFFLSGIDGAADLDQDGAVTSNELALYISPEVTNYVSDAKLPAQTPDYGQEGSGQFVFFYKQTLKTLDGQSESGDVKCPDGSEWTGDGCVLDEVTCPDGTSWQDDHCKPVKVVVTCPDGSFWDGKGCKGVDQSRAKRAWQDFESAKSVLPPELRSSEPLVGTVSEVLAQESERAKTAQRYWDLLETIENRARGAGDDQLTAEIWLYQGFFYDSVFLSLLHSEPRFFSDEQERFLKEAERSNDPSRRDKVKEIRSRAWEDWWRKATPRLDASGELSVDRYAKASIMERRAHRPTNKLRTFAELRLMELHRLMGNDKIHRFLSNVLEGPGLLEALTAERSSIIQDARKFLSQSALKRAAPRTLQEEQRH